MTLARLPRQKEAMPAQHVQRVLKNICNACNPLSTRSPWFWRKSKLSNHSLQSPKQPRKAIVYSANMAAVVTRYSYQGRVLLTTR